MVEVNRIGQFNKSDVVLRVVHVVHIVIMYFNFCHTEGNRGLLVLTVEVVAQFHLQLMRAFPARE